MSGLQKIAPGQHQTPAVFFLTPHKADTANLKQDNSAQKCPANVAQNDIANQTR